MFIDFHREAVRRTSLKEIPCVSKKSMVIGEVKNVFIVLCKERKETGHSISVKMNDPISPSFGTVRPVFMVFHTIDQKYITRL